MDQPAIQKLFQEFAAPLGKYVVLGARREAAATLARNLWAALIAGPQAELQMWESLQNTDGAQPAMLDAIRACYHEHMKPVVSCEKLAALRQHYGIRPREPSSPSGS